MVLCGSDHLFHRTMFSSRKEAKSKQSYIKIAYGTGVANKTVGTKEVIEIPD